MTAATGIEIGSFNSAYLCDFDPDNSISTHFESECALKYYNQSIYVDLNRAHSYALNKMADYHYNKSKNNVVEIDTAIDFYSRAYLRGDSQGLFNLALLIEYGYRIPYKIWNRIGLSHLVYSSNYTQINGIYEL